MPKVHYIDFRTKKLHFGPISAPFGLKISKQDFLQKRCSSQISSLYTTVILGEKNQKNLEHQFFIQLQKPHFGSILTLFGMKTSTPPKMDR